jgi:endoglucanase
VIPRPFKRVRVRPGSAAIVPLLLVGGLFGFGGKTVKSGMANPLLGLTLRVDPGSSARVQAEAWKSSRPQDAAQLEKIASQPQADWFGDWNKDVRGDVQRRTREARADGSTPVFVAYDIPGRDCGQYSAGGASGRQRYQAWVDGFAQGLGDGPAIVILEPDAVAGADCLSEAGRDERYAMLRDAVATLKAKRGVRVYLDAGNPSWKSASDMARRLRGAGVDQADGFALNVSNTIATEKNVAYGEHLSAALGGAHFVIDTSRNGSGAPANGEWCNPGGRSLGQAPSVTTGHELVDAYLWIKRPGESDGTCNGGPAAGKWWADYALGLARRTAAGHT